VARLVAVHAPGHTLDARLVEQLGQLLHRRAAAVELARIGARAERRVAAAAQEEVPAPDPVLVQVASAEHHGPEGALGAEARQRGGRGEQLGVGGEDARRARAPREDPLAVGQVDHIRARLAPGEAHVARERALQVRLRRCGGQQQGGGEQDRQCAAHREDQTP
jgi:hypothetical protein